jgi:uracil-DNA glycosylase family 4
MSSKNLTKCPNDTIIEYYHSTGLYNSLIYKEFHPNQNLSKNDQILNLIKKFKNNAHKFAATKDNILFSNQNFNSNIMIIGDMPSLEDENTQNIFSSKIGELLDKMLNAISLSRTNIYLTNILPFHIQNLKSVYVSQKNLIKKLTHEHIEIINPKIILILGSFPLEILFDDLHTFTKHRGQWLSYPTSKKKIDTLCSFHPNFLLQQPSQKKNSWIDLQAFQKKIKNFNI